MHVAGIAEAAIVGEVTASPAERSASDDPPAARGNSLLKTFFPETPRSPRASSSKWPGYPVQGHCSRQWPHSWQSLIFAMSAFHWSVRNRCTRVRRRSSDIRAAWAMGIPGGAGGGSSRNRGRNPGKFRPVLFDRPAHRVVERRRIFSSAMNSSSSDFLISTGFRRYFQ